MTGIVFDIKEFAIFDGPGIRTTVFMKGCPLRCSWCHNPEGLSPKPELMVSKAACIHCGACLRVCENPNNCIVCGKCVPACRGGFRKIVGEEWSAEKLSKRLLKDFDIYKATGGGVTFSGGEPLYQWAFVSDVIRRMQGVHTAIETSGYCSDEVFSDAMKTCSLIMLDWKISDSQKHQQYTGVSQEPIKRHLEMLCRGNTPFILRLPIIPNINDNENHFETAAELVGNAEALIRIDVLTYQRAAGAKYEMIGKKYNPRFDESQSPRFYFELFEKNKIPYKLFS